MLAVRRVLPDSVDVDELAAVAGQTFPLACPPSVSAADIAAFVEANLSGAHFRQYLADPDRVVLTAQLEDRLVGYAMLVGGVADDVDVQQAVRVRPAVELSKMYVLPDVHGTGVSTALMHHALAAAAESGVGCVWLGVNQQNQRAQRFYAKHGFTVSGRRTFQLGGHREHDYVMVRVLQPGPSAPAPPPRAAINPMPEPGADQAAGTRLRLLGSVRQLTDGELARLYSYPSRLPQARIRANFIASLDGAATVDGATGGLGGPGDRALFNLLRALADVIVVGAGTVRTESYSGARLTVAERQHRQARGQSEVPQLAIVTESGRLDRGMPIFTHTEVMPLVLTCTAAIDATRQRLSGLAEVIDCSGDDPGRVDVRAVAGEAASRGLYRVLTEGGPTLFSSFIDADLIDELCLTVAPFVVGGSGTRIATGRGQVLTRMRCAHVLSDDSGYLYTRYVKGAEPADR